jgi:hypothetical protein
MEPHPPLSDLVEKALQAIGKLGLCSRLNRQYRRAYERLKAFAKKKNEECCSPDLLSFFLADTEQQYRGGVISRSIRNHLRRAALLLKEYLESGRIEWRVHKETTSPMPSSEQFLYLYTQYFNSLQSSGRSKNTIHTARSLIRQFLVFLDDNSCRSLSETPPTMVPAFFQHLRAHYQPTSMGVVTTHVRTFLESVEGGQRLLPLVPSCCLRNKPIIPVLSDEEHTALKRAVASPEVPLRGINR